MEIDEEHALKSTQEGWMLPRIHTALCSSPESDESLQDPDSFTVSLDFNFLNTWNDKTKKCSNSYLVFDNSDSPRMASQTHSHTEILKKTFTRGLNWGDCIWSWLTILVLKPDRSNAKTSLGLDKWLYVFDPLSHHLRRGAEDGISFLGCNKTEKLGRSS